MLHIEGQAGDPIWVMFDGQEPYVVGIRLDCGDGGVVYLTREQAESLANDLLRLLTPISGEKASIESSRA